MVNFCKHCGEPIENCKCQKDKVNATVNEFKEQRKQERVKKESLLERNAMIIPDNIAPADGEIPIKQYKLAKLRSRIRGQYSEGKLMITNKRLLFRAPGFSPRGKVFVQHEFAINEIAGVDVQVGTKISVLNILLSLLMQFSIIFVLSDWMNTIDSKSGFLAILLGLIILAISGVSFIVLSKHYWGQLAVISCALGVLTGFSDFSIGFSGISGNFFIGLIMIAVYIGWLITLFKICLTPDLIFTVKTNGAGEAITIRRKIWGLFFTQPQEYTGFSEVLPWDDAAKVAEELNTIIDELKTNIDDEVINKWKEN